MISYNIAGLNVAGLRQCCIVHSLELLMILAERLLHWQESLLSMQHESNMATLILKLGNGEH